MLDRDNFQKNAMNVSIYIVLLKKSFYNGCAHTHKTFKKKSGR